MYRIELSETSKTKTAIEYTIGGDLIVFARDTRNEVTGEWENYDVGISVDEFLTVAEIIRTRQIEHYKGIMPPEDEHGKKQMGYCDRDESNRNFESF